MRLKRLELLRYGHFTDVSLAFGPASLHVVLGANEAGKTTALHAIADALFGFPHSSPFAFLHESRKLRLGFSLVARDGREASFLREKRRAGGLASPDGAPLPETALLPFLGSADRALFERGFGLDATRLRAGASALLAAGGGAGDSVLAGMGLLHLRAAMASLEEEAKALAGDKRGRRALHEAAEAWKAATRRVQAAAVLPRDWAEAERAEAECAAGLARLAERREALLAEASRLRRARLAAPLLRDLDRIAESLARLAPAPALPADAAARLAAAEQAEGEASRQAEELRVLLREGEALRRDPPALAEAAAIEALGRLATLAGSAEQDLPGQREVAARAWARLEAAAQALPVPLAAGEAAQRIPPEAERRRAAEALQQRAAWRALVVNAAEARAEAEQSLAAAEAALAALPEAPEAAPLRRALEAARAEGRILDEQARARRARLAAEGAAQAALAALPLWLGDAAALAAAKLPLAATAEAAGAAWLAARERAREAAQAAASAAEALAGVLAEIEGLEAAGEVPSRAAILAARAARDAAWAAWRDGTPEASAPRFEALRDAADRLADQALAEAGRVSAHARLLAERATAQYRERAAREAAASAAADAEAAGAAWRALWAPVLSDPAEPPAMAEWCRQRAAVLELFARAAAAAEREAELADRLAAVEAPLSALLPGVAGGLGALLPAAEAALASAEARRLAAEEVSEARAAVASAEGKAARLAEAAEPGFAASLAAFGLAAEADEAALAQAVEAWGRIAEAAPLWQTASARVGQMEAALARFAATARETAARLGEASEGLAPEAVARGLAARLAAAREAEAQASGLERRIAAARQALAAAEREAAERAEALTALAAASGLPGREALSQAVAELAERAALLAAKAAAEERLAEAGDGFDEATLRAQLAALDPDAIPGRLAAIEEERSALEPERDALAERRAELRRKLAELERGRDAAAAAQEAANQLAAAQVAAERHARLHAARLLLGAAVERLRAERQGPLLRAAAAHFAALTRGRYAGLAVEEEESEAVLRARRADGTERLLAELSEGTRDQLHLALRLAAIEAHGAEAEPLPFIADDLLANFDDARAEAALAALAALGAQSQVILFTHHAHIAAMAAGLPGAEVTELKA